MNAGLVHLVSDWDVGLTSGKPMLNSIDQKAKSDNGSQGDRKRNISTHIVKLLQIFFSVTEGVSYEVNNPCAVSDESKESA